MAHKPILSFAGTVVGVEVDPFDMESKEREEFFPVDHVKEAEAWWGRQGLGEFKGELPEIMELWYEFHGEEAAVARQQEAAMAEEESYWAVYRDVGE